MHIGEDLVGEYVALQFSRPIYVFEYGAHLREGGETKLVPAPTFEPAPLSVEQMAQLKALRDAGQNVPTPRRISARDMVMGKLVDVYDDTVVIELAVARDDSQTVDLLRKHVSSDVIISCDLVKEVEAAPPVATIQKRAQAPVQDTALGSKIIF